MNIDALLSGLSLTSVVVAGVIAAILVALYIRSRRKRLG